MVGPFHFLKGQRPYSPEAHLKRVQDLHAKYPLNTTEKCADFNTRFIYDTFGKNQPWAILENIENFLFSFFDENNIYIPNVPKSLDRQILEIRERELSSPERLEIATRTIKQFLRDLPLPPSAYEEVENPTATVPLHVFIPNLAQRIQTIMNMVLNTRHGERTVFPATAYTMTTTVSALSGSDTKHVFPTDWDGDPLIFLNSTAFDAIFFAQVPFTIPRKTWASHGIILAPPNHGKTQLLGSLIAGFLQESSPVGCFVLDPHGDLFNILKSRVEASRLVVLDPDTNPPPLNFLDFGTSTEAQTLQTFSYLMSSLSGGLSDKQGAIVPYLLKLLRAIPHASLETLRLLVDEKVKRPEQSQFFDQIRTLPQVDQGFFHNQFYSSRMQETKDAIGWKLYSALSSDAFRQMFSSKTNSFSADAAMRERKVVLVKGARQALGDAGMQVFLQFIVAQFFAAALRREKLEHSARTLCLLCIDEAHHVFNSQTSNILTECRKYGLGLLAATQVVQQIPEDVKAAIYGATAIKIAGPVSHTDAMILAREMYTTGDFIRSMKAVEQSL